MCGSRLILISLSISSENGHFTQGSTASHIIWGSNCCLGNSFR